LTLSGKDFEKYKTAVVQFVRDLEKQDIKVRQRDIIDYYLESNLVQIENEKDALDESTRLVAVIDRIINKENILIVTEDNERDKNDRILSLNVNYDPSLSL